VAERRLLSTGEAARALGISRPSLSRWVKEGRVRPTLTTPGGQYRFDLDELREQMRRQPRRDPEPGE
jgi:excisionase family DNA binding protein